MRWKADKDLGTAGPKGTAHRLAHGLTEIQSWGSCLESARDLQGEAELTTFRKRAREAEIRAAYSRTEVLSDAIASLLSPPPIQPTGAGRCQV